MTGIYEELTAGVKVEIGEEERLFVEGYLARLKWWEVGMKATIILSGIWAIYGILTEHPLRYVGFVVCLILYFLCQRYKVKQLTQIYNYSNEKCHPEKTLSCFMIFAHAEAKKKKGWENRLFNIGLCLFHAGRFSEYKKILPLFGKYFPGDKGGVRYTLLCMKLAYQNKDAESLAAHTRVLKGLIKSEKNNEIHLTMQDVGVRNYCEQALKYQALLEAQEKGQYEAVRELLQTKAKKVTLMTQVINNYYLYYTAKAAGMEKEAAEHRAFVLEYGGNTLYKQELQQG